MLETTLSKVGNSMAVLLPKALRIEACLEPDDTLRLYSPRKGVVVIIAFHSDNEDKLARLKCAEAHIKARKESIDSWPAGASASDLISNAKDKHVDELMA